MMKLKFYFIIITIFLSACTKFDKEIKIERESIALIEQEQQAEQVKKEDSIELSEPIKQQQIDTVKSSEESNVSYNDVTNADQKIDNTEVSQIESEPVKENESDLELSTPSDTIEVITPQIVEVPTEADESQIVQSDIVKVSIRYMEHDILTETEIGYEDNQTVFSVTRDIAKQQKIHLDYTGKGSTTYIVGIDNIYEFDEGPESGWLYYVNGILQNKSCGAYTIAKGDVIEWKYTKALGKDIGAELE